MTRGHIIARGETNGIAWEVHAMESALQPNVMRLEVWSERGPIATLMETDVGLLRDALHEVDAAARREL